MKFIYSNGCLILLVYLCKNSKQLEVEVLDHLVVGQGKWVSLKERELGFV